VVARAVNAVVQVGCILFLARLLAPEDYGLVAMVTALTGFAPVLVDLGTRDAVVQRAHVTEKEVSALFWLTIGIGVTCALAISASAPLIAAFYREPRLTPIVLVSSLTFVAMGLTCQHQALLRRAVMFRELAVVDIAANVLSAGGAILLALAGFGYWALVIRPVATALFSAAGVWLYCRWLPGWPKLTSGVKQMMRFGLNLSGFSVTDFVSRNSDRVAVGRGLGATTLGYYQNALLVYDNLLDVLVLPLHGVAVASLSKLQHDHEELRRSWAKALSTVAFYAMPAFGLLAILSQDLIVLLLGPKWATAGVLLSILALRGIPHSIERTLGWLHVAAGRTDRWFRWGAAAAGAQLLALFVGLRFGTMGVVYAYVLFMYLMFIPTLAYAGSPLGIRARHVMGAVGAQLTGALITAGVGFGLRASVLASLPPVERMALLTVVYLTLYLAIVVGLFGVRTPVQVCVAAVKDLLPAPLTANFRFMRTRRPVIGQFDAALLEPGEKLDIYGKK
jgi:PST family polysaccharide transporter